jgi:hypothetical protein
MLQDRLKTSLMSLFLASCLLWIPQPLASRPVDVQLLMQDLKSKVTDLFFPRQQSIAAASSLPSFLVAGKPSRPFQQRYCLQPSHDGSVYLHLGLLQRCRPPIQMHSRPPLACAEDDPKQRYLGTHHPAIVYRRR